MSNDGNKSNKTSPIYNVQLLRRGGILNRFACEFYV